MYATAWNLVLFLLNYGSSLGYFVSKVVHRQPHPILRWFLTDLETSKV